MEKLTRLLIGIALWIPLMALAINNSIQYPAESYQHSFMGSSALDGWSSNNVDTVFRSTFLQLNATGNDAKIWHRLSLPRGRYTLSIATAFDLRIRVTAASWSLGADDTYLSVAQEGFTNKEYSTDFEVPGGDVFIILQIPSGASVAKLEHLSITPALTFTFVDSGYDYLAHNWSATSNNGLNAMPSALEITASNSDSKIYRRDIYLEQQDYILSAMGQNMDVELRASWQNKPLAVLNLGRNAQDIRAAEITIPAEGNYYLVAKVRGGPGAKGKIRGIRIKPLINYTFYSGTSGIEGWNPTGVNPIKYPGSLELEAMTVPTQDSKIGRKVSLEPEEYILTVTARGNAGVRLGIRNTDEFIVKVVSSNSDEWVTKSYYYKSTTAQLADLELFVHGVVGKTAEFKRVRIERAPMTFYPDPVDLRGWVHTLDRPFNDWFDLTETGANVVRLLHKPRERATKLAASGVISNGSDIFDPVTLSAMVDELEREVVIAKLLGVKVIIDLHQGPFNISDDLKEQTQEFWDFPGLESNFIKYWSAVAERLSAYPDTVLGYDLFNEPINWNNRPRIVPQWRDMAQNITLAIRSFDQHAWIIYQTGPGALDNGMDYFKPLADHKVIYSRHIYDPLSYTHQGLDHSMTANVDAPGSVNYPTATWDKQFIETTLAPADRFQAKYQVPMFVGEFNVIKWAPGAEMWLKDVLDLMESRRWSWTIHAWRQWQGWDLELNEAYYFAGDDIANHTLPPNETSARMDVVQSAFRKNR